MAGYTRRWLSPSKLRDYYVDPHVFGLNDAGYQLYWAVCDGKICARHQGRILSPEETYKLREKQWGSGRYDLPPDLELSVDDAQEIWGPPTLDDLLTCRTAMPADVVDGGGSRLEVGSLEYRATIVSSVSKETKAADRTSGSARSVEQESIAAAIGALWSSVVPSGMLVKVRNKKIREWQQEKTLAVVSDRTIRRYFSDLKLGQ